MPSLILPFTLPAGARASVFQGFGPVGPKSGEPPYLNWRNFHRGLDYNFVNADGTILTPVALVAPAAGTVTRAELDPNAVAYPDLDPNGGYGLMVVIDHGDGYQTLYGHLSALSCTKGTVLAQGQHFADSGGGPPPGPGTNSGNSSGPHLHFELDHGPNTPVDPRPFLSGQSTLGAPVFGATQLGSYQQVIIWARQAGIPQNQLATAAAIAMAESLLNLGDISPLNSDGSKDYGLWQISVSATKHAQYDTHRLVTDGLYNAQAMAAISGKGTNWQPWTTYGYRGNPPVFVGWGSVDADYYKFLQDAQAALAQTPPGTTGATLGAGAGAGGSTSTTDSGGVLLDVPGKTPLAPALAPQTVRLLPVRLALSSLTTVPHARGVALLWLESGYIPVMSCDVQLSSFREAGALSNCQVSIDWLRQPGHAALLAALTQRVPTQITVVMGYSADVLRLNPDSLDAVFSGLLDAPVFTWSGHDRTVDLAGPDLSAIFSGNGSTLTDTSTFQNQTSSAMIQSIVDAHNPSGGGGLQVDADSTATLAGQSLGADFMASRGSGATEWDTMTQLAQNDGMLCFFEGTRLQYRRFPTKPPPPVVLEYGVLGHPPSNVTKVSLTVQPHAKRDYQIQTTSWNTNKATLDTVTAGNPDSPDLILVPQDIDTSHQQLVQRAAALWAEYSSTEVLLDLEIEGVVPLALGQAIGLRSDEVLDQYTYPQRLFYPARTVLHYSWAHGLSTTLTCTSRPYALAGTVSAQALPSLDSTPGLGP